MTTRKRARRSFAVAGLLSLSSIGLAGPVLGNDGVSQRVKNMCTPDAERLCPQHPLGSEQMRYCMEAKFSNISRDCVKALEDDGLVSPGTHKQHTARRG